jgi:hypothetical protein
MLLLSYAQKMHFFLSSVIKNTKSTRKPIQLTVFGYKHLCAFVTRVKKRSEKRLVLAMLQDKLLTSQTRVVSFLTPASAKDEKMIHDL